MFALDKQMSFQENAPMETLSAWGVHCGEAEWSAHQVEHTLMEPT